MATKEELSEQLAVTQKLAAAVEQMARSMSRVESSFDNQISAVEKLTAAIQTLKGQDLGALNQVKLDALQKEMKDTATGTTALSGRIKDLGNRMAKKFPTEVAVGAAALSGFIQGIRNVLALGKGLTGFFTGFVDGAASVAASIIAIPFKMFNAFVDMAAAAGGGMNELAQAIENLRKEIGDLKGPGASAVLDTTKTLKGFSDTGLSAWRVFGTLAERLEHVTKVAVAMDATFDKLTEEFRENGGALLAFQKGLGVSEEQMKAIGDRAITMGKPMTKVFLDMTKQTLALGRAFDIDQKLIGKDMVKALQNVKHFGALTVKEIAQASVYARKLGIELDKIVGTLDAFETFDAAAENAAKLSQAFGVQIDAFKMMDAQNPAEQIDMLRKAFREAGIDADKFTRQQAKLLAQSTGLDEAIVRQAFSAKNYGVSLDKVKKQSEAAEKKTMTQAEAMGKLADSIERMVKSGAGQKGGFWQMFVEGFLGGIQASKEFREIIWNIKRSLQMVYFEGVRLGKAFVEMFPGTQQFLRGIADFFNPAKFKKLVGGVVDILRGWMDDLGKSGGKASFSDMMKKLQKHFFDFFDTQSESGKHMLTGFKTVFKTITKIIAEAIKWAADKVGDGISFIIDLVTGKKKIDTSSAEGSLGFLAEALSPLGDALVSAWRAIAPKLRELIKILGKKLFTYLKSDEFLDSVKPALPYIAAALFGPAFGRALLGAGISVLGKATVSLFTSGSAKKIMEDVAKRAADEVMEASKKVPAAGGGASKAMEQAGSIGQAAQKTDKQTSKVDWRGLASKLFLIAGVVATGLVGLWVALQIVKGESVKDVLKAGLFATTALIVAGEAAVVAGGIQTFLKKVDWKGLAFGLLAAAGVVLVVGVVAAGLTFLTKRAGRPDEIKAAADIMLKMSVVFLAMIPLILAATAMGALVAGPQAPLVLATMATGLAVITGAVGAVAGIVTAITKELATMKVDAQFQQKVDVFLSIMRATQAFADTLVKLIGLMMPSFGEIISGKIESFAEKVTASTKLIKEMVGVRGQGFGMIGIIETVMQAIKDLNVGGPGMIEAANIFSNVMTGITGFMQAAAPPESFYTEGGSFINKLVDPTHNFQNLATDVGYYSRLMREGVMTMLTGKPDGSGDDGVLGIIKRLTILPVPDPASAGVIANLLNSTAGMLKAITPNPETLRAFQTTVEESAFWGLAKTKVEKLNVPAIRTTVEMMVKVLQGVLPTLVDKVIGAVVDKGKDLTKDQIKNIEVMAGILGSVMNITSALANMAKGKKVTPTELADAVHWAVEEAPDVGAMFDGMAKNVPKLFTSIIDMVSGIKLSGDFVKRFEGVKSIFGFVSEIPKLAMGVAEASKASGGTGEISTEPMFKAMATMAMFFYRIVNEKGWGTSRPVLVELLGNTKTVDETIRKGGGAMILKVADTLKTLFSNLETVGSSLKTVTTLTSIDPAHVQQAVTNIFDAISKSMDSMTKAQSALMPESLKTVQQVAARVKEYAGHYTKMTEAIKTGGIGTAIGALSDMVKKTQELDDQLNKLPKIGPVTAKLEAIGKAAGLGGKAVYTVKSKDVVINMYVNVTMDAGEVEKAMIMRANSSIRNRLDFLAEEAKAGPLILPKGTSYTPGPGAPSGISKLGGDAG